MADGAKGFWDLVSVLSRAFFYTLPVLRPNTDGPFTLEYRLSLDSTTSHLSLKRKDNSKGDGQRIFHKMNPLTQVHINTFERNRLERLKFVPVVVSALVRLAIFDCPHHPNRKCLAVVRRYATIAK